MLLGITLIVIPKKKNKYGDIANAIGLGFILGAIIAFVPELKNDYIKHIKQQGIEEYLKGDMIVTHNPDSTITLPFVK